MRCKWFAFWRLTAALLLVAAIDSQSAGQILPRKKHDSPKKPDAAAKEQPGSEGRQPELVAERTELSSRPVPAIPDPQQPDEHPLMPAIRWAYEGIANMEKISDYSATLCKRERHDGKLNDYEYMFIKVRHKPFSVYIYFLSPPSIKGQEVIYVEGQNNGNMWAHTVGIKDRLVGTVSLSPTSAIAMKGQRYPLTEIGILNLTRRLVEVAERDAKFGECEVKFLKGAKINDRTCTCIQVVHPVPRRVFLFHIARIYVDDELNVPIRYEAWDWPKQPGGEPELMEEYTYLNLKLNNGFTDADFDIRNPNYKFR